MVNKVVALLGHDRAVMEKETVGQLRLMLKESTDQDKAAMTVMLPKGLARMKKEELQEARVDRGLTYEGKGREQMIRDLRAHAKEVDKEARAMTGRAASSTSTSETATTLTRTARPVPKAAARTPKEGFVRMDMDSQGSAWEFCGTSPEALGERAAASPDASSVWEACLQRDMAEMARVMGSRPVDMELVRLLRPDLAERLS